MAHIQADSKTGILNFIRRYPTDVLTQFDTAFFRRSLKTRDKTEANKRAVVALVEYEREVADARQKLGNDAGQTALGSQAQMIDPVEAINALESWCETEIGKAALLVANGVHSADESSKLQRSDLIVALRGSDRFRGYSAVPDFDDRLIEILASRDFSIPRNHPILKILRPAFRDAWLQVEEATDKMQRGGGVDWDWSNASPLQMKVRGETTRQKSSTSNPTLSKAVELWSTGDGVRGAKKPAKRTIQEAKRGQKLFTDLHGDLPVREITGKHAIDLRDKLADDSNGTRKAVQARTINKMLNLLAGVMKFAKQRGAFGDMQSWSRSPTH